MLRFFHLMLLLFYLTGYAQEQKQVDIRQSGSFEVDEARFPGAKILKKNDQIRVHLHHDGMDIWSDEAYLYEADNFFEALGNVVVRQGDSLQMTSAYLEYSGSKRFGVSKSDVVLENNTTTLFTDTLYLDRAQQEAYYTTKGTIIDEETTINSLSGTYFIESKKYEFQSDVEIQNPDFEMFSDRLDFYTENKHAYFYGPTTIIGPDYEVFCRRGYYDTENKMGYFQKEAAIDYNARHITGDSIYFDDKRQYASANQNVQIIDTVDNNIIRGHFGEVFQARDSAIVTLEAVAINVIDGDSLYIHADTLVATGTPDDRILRGYYGVRIFKSDLSGKSDSIYVRQKLGRTKLLRLPLSVRDQQLLTPSEITQRNPVLWFGKSQMTGDVVHLINDTVNNVLDSLVIYNNAFIVEQDSLNPNNHNQIKGIDLFGKFVDNELQTVDIVKNAEMIYYLYDDEDLELVGIDKTVCSSMRLFIEDNGIKTITFYTQPEGTVYPENDLPENARRLSAFLWRGNEVIESIDQLIINKMQPPVPKPKVVEKPLKKKNLKLISNE